MKKYLFDIDSSYIHFKENENLNTFYITLKNPLFFLMSPLMDWLPKALSVINNSEEFGYIKKNKQIILQGTILSENINEESSAWKASDPNWHYMRTDAVPYLLPFRTNSFKTMNLKGNEEQSIKNLNLKINELLLKNPINLPKTILEEIEAIFIKIIEIYNDPKVSKVRRLMNFNRPDFWTGSLSTDEDYTRIRNQVLSCKRDIKKLYDKVHIIIKEHCKEIFKEITEELKKLLKFTIQL